MTGIAIGEKGKTMYSIFGFSCTYHTNGRERSEADMLDAIRRENYESFLLTNHFGDYDTFLKAFQCIRQDIPAGTYQHLISGYDVRTKYLMTYEGVIIYEDDRPFLVFGKGGEK